MNEWIKTILYGNITESILILLLVPETFTQFHADLTVWAFTLFIYLLINLCFSSKDHWRGIFIYNGVEAYEQL